MAAPIEPPDAYGPESKSTTKLPAVRVEIPRLTAEEHDELETLVECPWCKGKRCHWCLQTGVVTAEKRAEWLTDNPELRNRR